MTEPLLAFGIWACVACFIIGMGIRCFWAKEVTGFWANVRVCEIDDVKRYNRAMGKLWIGFGCIMILMGTPMLLNSDWILLSVLLMPVLVIGTMVTYILVIEKKYRKK